MEIFRDVVGYEGLYQVSNEGRVKSLARDVEWRGTIRHYPEHILKPQTDANGYMFVSLYKDGKAKTYQVHRLVASVFIPNPENKPQVNHKDEDKSNNNVENLEWCTHEYNINYGSRNQRAGEALNNRTDLSIPIGMLTKYGEFIRTFPSASEAMRWLRANGYPKAAQTAIIQCCKGRPNYNSAYGFKWQYSKKELS